MVGRPASKSRRCVGPARRRGEWEYGVLDQATCARNSAKQPWCKSSTSMWTLGEFVSFLAPVRLPARTRHCACGRGRDTQRRAIKIDGRGTSRACAPTSAKSAWCSSLRLFPNRRWGQRPLRPSRSPASGRLRSSAGEEMLKISSCRISARASLPASAGSSSAGLARALAIPGRCCSWTSRCRRSVAKIRVSLARGDPLPHAASASPPSSAHGQEKELRCPTHRRDERRSEEQSARRSRSTITQRPFRRLLRRHAQPAQGQGGRSGAGQDRIDGPEFRGQRDHPKAGEACTVALRPEAATLQQSELQEAPRSPASFAKENPPRPTPGGTIEEVSFSGRSCASAGATENRNLARHLKKPHATPTARQTGHRELRPREDCWCWKGRG